MPIGLVRLVHPAPAAAVVALTAALAWILAAQADEPISGTRILLIVVAVAGSQVLTGALNDWADRDRDARGQPTKPIPAGAVTPRAALTLALVGGVVQLAASIPLGPLALGIGIAASGSALAYDLWLSRTPASFVPYLVSFGLLPLWVATGVGVPPERMAVAPLVVGPFAIAAHLANALRDFEADAALGSGNLAQRLGRRRALGTAWVLAMGVGIGTGTALAIAGRLGPVALLLGVVGLAAVGQGIGGPNRFWVGMLVAAVAWTAAWGLSTG